MPKFRWLRSVVSTSLVVFGSAALADPLIGGLETGTSISQSYDARSVFSNPAALGFGAELNGYELSSSFTYGTNRGANDDLSFGLGLGNVGFGVERWTLSPTTELNRYHFVLGVPLSPVTFFGMRYRLNRPSVGVGYDSVDAGLQIRPSRFWSLGFMTNDLNRPDVSGTKLPVQFVGGLTIRPLPRLTLTIDGDTSTGTDFFKRWGYQATIAVEPRDGIHLRAGYHDRYQFQVGLQIELGRASLYSTMQPGVDGRRWVNGFQTVGSPYKSVIVPQTALSIDISPGLSERAVVGGIFLGGRPSLLDLIEQIDEAVNAPEIGVILVKMDSFPLGLASATEVFEALMRARDAGKQIEVFLGQAGIKEYLVASAATRIHLEPAGELRFLGLRAERYFLQGTLDKVGLEGQFLARGEYKSAPEQFTRQSSSELNKKVTLEELKNAENEILAILARGRGLKPEVWRKALETALFSADEALAMKLIDAVDSYRVEKKKIERSLVVTESAKTRSNALTLPKRVAIVVADGAILQQKMRVVAFGGGGQATPDALESRFERALGDPRTRAIVLRVSSPGGEVLASHEIAMIVENARRKKPVIISMGDVAASGGYYIAAPGDRIFAKPLTLTGSIGVFLGKVSAAGLYKSIKLNKEILSHAPYPGLFTEDRPWTDGERAILQRRLDKYYESFRAYVAKHRGLTTEQAESAAKGRVWLGKEALEKKIVDEMGGYKESIAYAAGRAGLGAGEYEAFQVRDTMGLFSFFDDENGFLKMTGVESVVRLLPKAARRELMWMESLAENPFLYISEFEIAE